MSGRYVFVWPLIQKLYVMDKLTELYLGPLEIPTSENYLITVSAVIHYRVVVSRLQQLQKLAMLQPCCTAAVIVAR